MRTIVRMTLAGEDLELVCAESGQAALDLFDQHVADVVLADISMDPMDGYELCAAIKGRRSGTSVLLLHGPVVSIDKERMSEVDADSALEKPFETEELIRTIWRLGKSSVEGSQVKLSAVEGMGDPLAIEIDAEPPPDGLSEPLPSFELIRHSSSPKKGEISSTKGRAEKTGPVEAVDPASRRRRRTTGNRSVPGGSVKLPEPPPGLPLPVSSTPDLEDDIPTKEPPHSSDLRVAATGKRKVDPAAYAAVVELSRDVIERIVWEVVPDMAETIIKEHLDRMLDKRSR